MGILDAFKKKPTKEERLMKESRESGDYEAYLSESTKQAKSFAKWKAQRDWAEKKKKYEETLSLTRSLDRSVM